MTRTSGQSLRKYSIPVSGMNRSLLPQKTSSGIVSSSVAGTPGTTLGYAEASSVFTDFPATFAGESVDNTSVLVRFTYGGDANLDRHVDTVDFNVLAANFSQSAKTFSQGDFSYDGKVDTIDFNLLASNFSTSLPATAAPSTAASALAPPARSPSDLKDRLSSTLIEMV